MQKFFPMRSSVIDLWETIPAMRIAGQGFVPPRQRRNLKRWTEIEAERAEQVKVAQAWRNEAIKDGWLPEVLYAQESIMQSCKMRKANYYCHFIARPSIRTDSEKDSWTLGGGDVHCWAEDKMQIPVPLIYPGWQYFLDAPNTCPHCHRGPNRPFFEEEPPCAYCGPGRLTGLPGNACENCMNTGLAYPELREPVKTMPYSFTGRACAECIPALRMRHERPGWND